MFDLLYFTSCCPAPNVQHSVLVFGDPEQDIYLCQFLENHIVLDSHLTGRFIEHPRELVEKVGWFSVISFQFSVISFQFSVIGFQFFKISKSIKSCNSKVLQSRNSKSLNVK